jgi:hypothetical protein
MSDLRPELPDDIPKGIAALPVDRGYPVPWFVGWVDDKPDFRVIRPGGVRDAVKGDLCWICGRPLFLGRRAYVIGPMCAVNRVSAEPPSHIICADWSARACPFLTRPHARRREAGMPEDGVAPAGTMIRRNPGVALVWVTNQTTYFTLPDGGVLFDVGHPMETRWYAEGRQATRVEVLESIGTGMPLLAEEAEREGPKALAALDQMAQRAMKLLPAA